MNLNTFVSHVYVETLHDFAREVSPERPVRLLLSHQTQGQSPLFVRVGQDDQFVVGVESS